MFVELIIGDKLRKLRESKGLSYDEIVSRCNLPSSIIQGTENTNTLLTSDVISIFVSVLDADEKAFYQDIIESNFYNKAFTYEVLHKSGKLYTTLKTYFFAHLRNSLSIEYVSNPEGVTHNYPCVECQNGILSIDCERNLWYCETCKNGGDVIAYLMIRNNLEFKDAIKFAYEKYVLKEWQFARETDALNAIINETVQDEIQLEDACNIEELCSPEAERAILGTMLVDNTQILKNMDFIRNYDFSDAQNRAVFDAIEKSFDKYKKCDTITVENCISESRLFSDISISAFLNELVECSATEDELKVYADIVKNNSIRRKIHAAADSIKRLVFDKDSEVCDVMWKSDRELGRILHNNLTYRYDLITANTVMKSVLDDIQRKYSNLKGEMDIFDNISTGLLMLDELIGGFTNCGLYLIAGRPSMGKTSLLLTFAKNMILNNKRVGFFAMGQDTTQLMSHILCSTANINTADLRGGCISDEDWERIYGAYQLISASNMVFDDCPDLTMEQMKQRADFMQREHNIDVLFIDSLQNLSGNTHKAQGADAVKSSDLKLLARELNIPIVVTSKLSGKIEKRPNKRPMSSDLRGSKEIEKNADVVMFIYRENYYKQYDEEDELDYEMPEIERVEINVYKNKSGPTGQVQVGFNHRYASFENLTE